MSDSRLPEHYAMMSGKTVGLPIQVTRTRDWDGTIECKARMRYGIVDPETGRAVINKVAETEWVEEG